MEVRREGVGGREVGAAAEPPREHGARAVFVVVFVRELEVAVVGVYHRRVRRGDGRVTGAHLGDGSEREHARDD